MTQPVTVYRWDDPGAPQMSTTSDLWPGILNILKKCLVDGYGTKDPAGWTVDYEDVPGNKCVFRNDTVEGSGGYVQFWRYNNSITWFQGAASCNGVDQLINPGFVQGINLSTNFTNGRWVIIASKTAFYLCLAREGADGISMGATSYSHFDIFVGDLVNTSKNDPGMFFAWGLSSNSLTAGSTGLITGGSAFGGINSSAGTNVGMTLTATNTASGYKRVPVAVNGAPSTQNYTICDFGVSITVSGETVTSGPPKGNTILSPVLLTRNVSSPTNDEFEPDIRGSFPGLSCLPNPHYFGEVWPFFLENKGRNYYAVRWTLPSTNQRNGGARRLIDTTSWELPNRD